MKAKPFKFFNDESAGLSYVVNEILATLDDDMLDCAQHGDTETVRDLRHKIADIRRIAPLIENAHILHGFAALVARMTTAEEMDTKGEEMCGDDACATLSELIVSARSKVQQ